MPAVIGGAIAFVVYPNLDFTAPSGVNRVVAYSAALIALPAPIAALICGIKCVRYILLAVWPARVCVSADDDGLTMRLGPFGTRWYPSTELSALYPFEITDEDIDGGFEAYLPEEEQVARLLPRLTHPNAPKPLHRTILQFSCGDEASIAAKLRPVIQRWRAKQHALAQTPESRRAH